MSLEIHFKNALSRIGYQLRQVPAELWGDDEVFRESLRLARGRTLLDPASAFMLHQFARRAAVVPGDCAELGVYRGGSALIMSRALEGVEKTIHLFDTFAGLPPADGSVDLHKKGDFESSLEETRTFLRDRPWLAFRKGLFPETAAELTDRRFAFVHVDADLYRSVRDACEFFYPRLSPGGSILFDDYGLPTCPGVKKAVDEFFLGNPEPPLRLPTGQAVATRF